MQEILIVPAIHQYFQEQAHNLEMAGCPETSIGSVDAAGDNPKLPARKFLGEQVVLSIEGTFMETAQLIESVLVEEHEHSSTERFHDHGAILGEIVSDVENVIGQRSFAAPYIGGDTL